MSVIKWSLIILNTIWVSVISVALVKSIGSFGDVFIKRFIEPEDLIILVILTLLLILMMIVNICNILSLIKKKFGRFIIVINTTITSILLFFSYFEWKYESPDFLIWIGSTVPYIVMVIISVSLGDVIEKE